MWEFEGFRDLGICRALGASWGSGSRGVGFGVFGGT